MTSRKDRKILLVDDDPDSLAIISEALKWDGYQIKTTNSGREAIERLNDWNPDMVLLDVNMPEFSGVETLKNLRQKEKYVSVVFISGTANTEAVVAGLEAGADDYIAKPFAPLELLARVRAQLRIKDLNDQLRTANTQLKELAETDDLTGLLNMRSVYQRLDLEIQRAKRFNRQICVVMLDMDFFKTVNDGHDHLFGSYVLNQVGGIIKKNIRTIDIGARYGGDEFLIVLTEINERGAHNFCERLREAIKKTTFLRGDDKMNLTASLGYTLSPLDNKPITGEDLVRIADHALYEAKETGRDKVVSAICKK